MAVCCDLRLALGRYSVFMCDNRERHTERQRERETETERQRQRQRLTTHARTYTLIGGVAEHATPYGVLSR